MGFVSVRLLSMCLLIFVDGCMASQWPDDFVTKYPNSNEASSFAYGVVDHSVRSELLSAHNAVRRHVSPPASNMLFMVWSMELERLAVRWVERCEWGHDPDLNSPDGGGRGGGEAASKFPTIGQNLFAIQEAFVRNGSIGIRSIVGAWASEKEEYYFNTRDSYCSYNVCGNYTQVVWAESLYLGCGMKFCSPLKGFNALSPSLFFICNYGPGGNTIGRHPYDIGHSCSKCPSDFNNCVDNLCEAFPRCQPVKECKPVDKVSCLCDGFQVVARQRFNVAHRPSSSSVVAAVFFAPLTFAFFKHIQIIR